MPSENESEEAYVQTIQAHVHTLDSPDALEALESALWILEQTGALHTPEMKAFLRKAVAQRTPRGR